MSLTTLQIPSYQVPKFYRLLDTMGFIQLPPKANFEVYRGQLLGEGLLVIYHTGKVVYQDFPLLQKIVTQAITQLDLPPPVTKNTYAVLAKPSRSKKQIQFQHSHLNVWLTPTQYTRALDKFYDHYEFSSYPSTEGYVDAIFGYKQYRIEFHTNGKVVSRLGFQAFASLLRQAIMENQPYTEYDLIIGQDEVGSGERIGPLVISTTALTPKQMIDLQLSGIKDSKMIPMSIIGAMAEEISNRSTASYSWLMLPDDFDSEFEATQGIVDLLWQGHSALTHKVVETLEYYGKRIMVLIDEFSKDFVQYTQAYNDLQVEVKLVPNAEQQSTSVAAASILAKASRQRWISVNERVYCTKFKRSKVPIISKQDYASKVLKW